MMESHSDMWPALDVYGAWCEVSARKNWRTGHGMQLWLRLQRSPAYKRLRLHIRHDVVHSTLGDVDYFLGQYVRQCLEAYSKPDNHP